MKKTLIAASIAAVLGFSSAVLAAETTPGTQTTTGTQATQAVQDYKYRASDVIGMDVTNQDDETVGQIDDLLITGNDSVVHAVVSVGGWLGIGDKLVTIPYEELQVDPQEDRVVYNTTQEQLEQRPEFNYREGETWWGRTEDREARWENKEETTEGVQQERQDVMEEKQELQEEKKD